MGQEIMDLIDLVRTVRKIQRPQLVLDEHQQPSLLEHLSYSRVLKRLTGLDAPARDGPAPSLWLIHSEHQQNPSLSVLDHGTRRQSPHPPDRTDTELFTGLTSSRSRIGLPGHGRSRADFAYGACRGHATGGTQAGDEGSVLPVWLDRHRATLLMKLDGLTEDQAR